MDTSQNKKPEQWREDILPAAKEYTENQGTAYPLPGGYLAMINSQIKEAFYSGAEWMDKNGAPELKAKVEAQEKEIKELKERIEALLNNHGLTTAKLLQYAAESTVKEQGKVIQELREALHRMKQWQPTDKTGYEKYVSDIIESALSKSQAI